MISHNQGRIFISGSAHAPTPYFRVARSNLRRAPIEFIVAQTIQAAEFCSDASVLRPRIAVVDPSQWKLAISASDFFVIFGTRASPVG